MGSEHRAGEVWTKVARVQSFRRTLRSPVVGIEIPPDRALMRPDNLRPHLRLLGSSKGAIDGIENKRISLLPTSLKRKGRCLRASYISRYLDEFSSRMSFRVVGFGGFYEHSSRALRAGLSVTAVCEYRFGALGKDE